MPRKNDKRLVYFVLVAFALVVLIRLFAPDNPHLRRMAKVVKTQACLNAVETAVLQFHADLGRLPSSLQSLSTPGEESGGRGPYLDPAQKLDQDAWGKPLLYELTPNGGATVVSYGEDGQPGGTGADADLIMRITPATLPSTTPAEKEIPSTSCLPRASRRS
jgi:general secretion pathway protein G